MIILTASKSCLTASRRELLVEGAVNVNIVQFVFSSDWDGLTKTAVFQAGSDKYSVLLNESNEAPIPWEVLQNPRRTLYAGVYGTNGESLVLPTIWTSLGIIQEGANPGQDTQPPTPDVYSQILQVAKDAEDVAQSVRDDADSGKFNGEQGPTGPQGYTYTPAVSEEGVISWTNDGSLPNPSPVNIKGPQGKQGIQGVQGKQGERGYVYTPNVSQDGIISWTNDGDLENPDPVNITGPQGETGETPDITAGTVETLEPGQDATAEITGETPNLVLNLGIPKGQPGQDAPQIDDDVVSATNPWSSQKIVDTLAPPFEVSGAIVTCNPVAGYPLHVVSQIMPVQEGTGDPSPDNVRPISGRESVSVTRCADNIFHKLNLRLGKAIYYGGSVAVLRFIADSIRAVFQIKCLPNRTYSFYNPQYQKYWLNRIVLCNSDGTMGYQNVALYTDPGLNYESYTFTLQNYPATDLLIQFEKVDKSEFTQNDVDALTTMLIFGTTPPTAYEPYQGADYTLTLPETIYGGTLDAVTGVGSETWDCITSDSSLWSKVEYTDRTSFRAELFGATPDATRLIICDKATRSTSTTFSTQEIGSIRYNANTLQIACEKGTTKEQFAETYGVIQIAYPLAEPVPIQATGGQTIPALSGANTIYTDGDSVTVSGRADPNAVINNLAQRIAALEEQAING